MSDKATVACRCPTEDNIRRLLIYINSASSMAKQTPVDIIFVASSAATLLSSDVHVLGHVNIACIRTRKHCTAAPRIQESPGIRHGALATVRRAYEPEIGECGRDGATNVPRLLQLQCPLPSKMLAISHIDQAFNVYLQA